MATPGSGPVPQIDREGLFGDRDLFGLAFCTAYAELVDDWLQRLFEHSLAGSSGISVVAIGGYGRKHLAPQSDLDVMMLHDGWAEAELEPAAQAMWFPVWDSKISLGHSVRTIDQAMELAADDLETATSLLSLRHLAGDAALSAEMHEKATEAWIKNRRSWLPQLVDDARHREVAQGEVAYLLEPDIKQSSGGLRDASAIRWIEAAGVDLLDAEQADLLEAQDVLLAARVELHRSIGRKGDVMFLEEQDAVADALGIGDADEMMSQVAAAARTITWIGDDVFLRVRNGLRRFKFLSSKSKSVDSGVAMSQGAVAITADAAVADDPALILRLAVAAAENEARIDRESLDELAEKSPAIPTPWDEETRSLFVRLLRTGHHAIPVVETLDQMELFTRLLPEWEPTRSKVQRNRYHRFTVDRHLLEATSIAAELAEHVDRPDLLVVGALLHDIGKGYPGDHTEVGVVLIDTIAANMGFDADDVDTLKRLCEHHLLLPDVATRRDLEDPGTISYVADQVRSTQFLYLLQMLTEADSIATGPSAWSRNKAHLINELVANTKRWLDSDGEDPVDRSFPTAQQLEWMDTNEHSIVVEGDTLSLVTRDRPGLFARIAGALALSNLNIVGAQIYTDGEKALEVVQVVDADDESAAVNWKQAVTLVEELVATDDDLLPRFEAQAKSRLQARVVQSPRPIESIRVDFDNELSADSTVIEVAGPDRLGLLYEVSTTIAGAGLDTDQAFVQTVGDDVVDSFYVRTLAGEKLTDESLQEELRTKLLTVLGA